MTKRLLLLGTALIALAACSPARIVSQNPHIDGLRAVSMQDPVFGGEVRVYEGGNAQGPTVVLLHGIGDDASAVWGSLVQRLRADYRIVAFDLPGFGASPGGNAPYTPENYARVLARVIAEFTEPPIYLAGHSLGGAIALWYAGEQPDHIAHLFLIGVPGILHEGAYGSYLISADRRGPGTDQDQGSDFGDRLTARLLRKFMRKTPDVNGIMESERMRELVLAGDPRRIAGFGVAIAHFGHALDRVRAPTTVFWGRDDAVAPPRTGRLLAAALPGRDLSLFADAGHVPMKDRTSAFNDAFLDRLRHGSPDPPAWHPPAPTPGSGTVRCRDHDDGMRIEGAHARILIEDCDNVVLDRITARYIEIRRSRVTLREPRIVGDDVGLRLFDSDVMVTAGRITADVPITLGSTFLDIAGTTLEGKRMLMRGFGRDANEVTLSVTRGITRRSTRRLHGIRALPPDQAL